MPRTAVFFCVNPVPIKLLRFVHIEMRRTKKKLYKIACSRTVMHKNKRKQKNKTKKAESLRFSIAST